jgi:hypothetical protein
MTVCLDFAVLQTYQTYVKTWSINFLMMQVIMGSHMIPKVSGFCIGVYIFLHLLRYITQNRNF